MKKDLQTLAKLLGVKDVISTLADKRDNLKKDLDSMVNFPNNFLYDSKRKKITQDIQDIDTILSQLAI